MPKFINIGAGLVITLLLALGLSNLETHDLAKLPQALSYGSNTLKVEIADSTFERITGLSGRTSLAPSSGLLFVFDRPGLYGIWMQDMLFPIDIIWLDSNFKVIDIEENVDPNTYPTIFTPDAKALYVLELNAGETSKLNLNIGNTLSPN